MVGQKLMTFWFLCVSCFFSTSTHSEVLQKSTAKSALPGVKNHTIQVYNDCLQKLTSVEASFLQKTRSNRIGGKLYLQKPGKLRIIYEPNPVGQKREILADGGYLTEYIFDREGALEESSSVSLSDTPLEIILNTKGIDLEHLDVQRIVSMNNETGQYTHIHIAKKDDPNSGHVVLIFKENKTTGPQFCGWIICDEHNKEIILELREINSNVIILPKTFLTSPQKN